MKYINYFIFILICGIYCCIPDDGSCKNNSDCCNKSCKIDSVYGGRCTNITNVISCMDPGSKCDNKYHKCCGSGICHSSGEEHGKCCLPIGSECIYSDDICCGSSTCTKINGRRICIECSFMGYNCNSTVHCCGNLPCIYGRCQACPNSIC